MAYTSFKASPKQFSYYRSLTGQALPYGCTKSKASQLIKQALDGNAPKKRDVVTVYGWQFSGLAAECLKEELKGVRYAVDLNYHQVKGPFKSLAEAEQVARSIFPDAAIEVSTSIRQQYMD